MFGAAARAGEVIVPARRDRRRRLMNRVALSPGQG
jgi:hypothetical protein